MYSLFPLDNVTGENYTTTGKDDAEDVLRTACRLDLVDRPRKTRAIRDSPTVSSPDIADCRYFRLLNQVASCHLDRIVY